MIDTIALWFHRIAEILYYINPLMMGLACVMWMVLYSRTSAYQSKITMRCYVLERQIDLLLQHYIIEKRDIEMIERLRKMYE